MKEITTYIKESLENNNMLWLLDKWFEMHDTEREEFMNIVFKCQKENTLNDNSIELLINGTNSLKNSLEEFISFVHEDPNYKKEETTHEDLIYQFKEILKQLIGYKSKKNHYITEKLNIKNIDIDKTTIRHKDNLYIIYSVISNILLTKFRSYKNSDWLDLRELFNDRIKVDEHNQTKYDLLQQMLDHAKEKKWIQESQYKNLNDKEYEFLIMLVKNIINYIEMNKAIYHKLDLYELFNDTLNFFEK